MAANLCVCLHSGTPAPSKNDEILNTAKLTELSCLQEHVLHEMNKFRLPLHCVALKETGLYRKSKLADIVKEIRQIGTL